MTAILTLIYCWLQEFFFSLTDWRHSRTRR